ncbi:MAG TPA: hypothetical protein VIL97_04860 [Thermoanaerobaculia bacterium]
MADNDSTLFRQGSHATTFRDMADFVQTIGERPLDKLISDLPELAKLSETKFRLAAHAIRRRCDDLTPVERDQLRVFSEEISANVEPAIAEKIRSIFKPLREGATRHRDRDRP